MELFSRIFTDYVEASVSYFHLEDNDAERIYQTFTRDIITINNGAICEQFIGQHLLYFKDW